MGRFSVEIELANYRDMMHVEDGTLGPREGAPNDKCEAS